MICLLLFVGCCCLLWCDVVCPLLLVIFCCVLSFGVARGGLLVVVRCSLSVASSSFIALVPLFVVWFMCVAVCCVLILGVCCFVKCVEVC